MAEVTREMILDYMQAKGGVVKNVDLVRHFRKYLQVSDPRAKDRARDQFKARVNEVAYIKADNKGEKYLYLKTDLTTGSTTERDSTHSKRDSSYSKRDSTYSLLSKRDSIHSILSDYSSSNSGQNYNRNSGHYTSSNSRTPPRDSPGHVQSNSVTSTPGHTQSGQSGSGQRSTSGQSSNNDLVSSKGTPLSLLGDSLLGDSAFNSFLSGGLGTSTTGTSSTGTGASLSGGLGTSTTGTSSTGTGASLSGGLGTSTTGTSSTGTGASLSGGLGTSTAAGSSTTDGGNSSFASSIFGTIGSFWGDSGITATSTSDSAAVSGGSTVEKKRASPPPPPVRAAMSTATTTSSSRAHNTTSKAVRSLVAGSSSKDVTLQSYKPITSPPHVTTRPPSPPAPTKTTRSPSPPPASRKLRPSPPTRRPPSPPTPTNKPPSPPHRNLNYTTTHTASGSGFSPLPPKTPSDSNELLAQVTSSFGGEIGSLLDSFGDFSMSSRPAATSSTSTTDQPSKTTPISSDQSTKKATSMTKSADQSSKLLTSSSDHSSGTLAAGRDTGPSPSSLSSVPQTRGSPAKSSATTTYTSVHPAVPTSPPAPGSPMRVPRRNVGPPLEPPPPPPSSSHSPLTRRHGSFEGAAHQWQASQEGSPHIRRVDSPRSEFSSNGVVSPPQSAGIHGGGGDMRMGRGISSGLPPLPPSAMLGPTADPRRISAAIANGGVVGVALRQHDRSARDRAQNSMRRSRNLDRSSNLDTLTRASITMTPPSIRRSMQVAGPSGGGGMYARPAPGSREDLSQHHSDGGLDQDGSLSSPSEDSELDPLEKEWMLACASADMEELHSLMIRDSTLINRRDFLHGTALHWAAKLGRCDIMSVLVLNGAFPNIKSNGGFTPLHLACQGGYDNAIAMLVRDQGANVNARDNSGRKPVDMLDYSCPDSIRALLTDKTSGGRTVHHCSDFLPSFSQQRNRLGSLTSTWASMPNSLEHSDDKKKRVSPKMSKRTFSFRNRHKVNSPSDKKERPRSHISESYDA